jgi:hypothetical protein
MSHLHKPSFKFYGLPLLRKVLIGLSLNAKENKMKRCDRFGGFFASSLFLQAAVIFGSTFATAHAGPINPKTESEAIVSGESKFQLIADWRETAELAVVEGDCEDRNYGVDFTPDESNNESNDQNTAAVNATAPADNDSAANESSEDDRSSYLRYKYGHIDSFYGDRNPAAADAGLNTSTEAANTDNAAEANKTDTNDDAKPESDSETDGAANSSDATASNADAKDAEDCPATADAKPASDSDATASSDTKADAKDAEDCPAGSDNDATAGAKPESDNDAVARDTSAGSEKTSDAEKAPEEKTNEEKTSDAAAADDGEYNRYKYEGHHGRVEDQEDGESSQPSGDGGKVADDQAAPAAQESTPASETPAQDESASKQKETAAEAEPATDGDSNSSNEGYSDQKTEEAYGHEYQTDGSDSEKAGNDNNAKDGSDEDASGNSGDDAAKADGTVADGTDATDAGSNAFCDAVSSACSEMAIQYWSNIRGSLANACRQLANSIDK